MKNNQETFRIFQNVWDSVFKKKTISIAQTEEFFKNIVYHVLLPTCKSVETLFEGWIPNKYSSTQQFKRLCNHFAQKDLLLSAYLISTLYAQSIGSARRSKLGAFFTPPDLSMLLVEEVLRSLDKKSFHYTFADICCGGGALLTPLARSLVKKMEESGSKSAQIVERIGSNLIGVEIDSFLLFLTRAYLLAELDGHILKSGKFPELKLQEADALVQGQDNAPFDIILGNPPYKKLTSEDHARLKIIFGNVIEENSNLYSAFLERSFQLLSKNGILSVIIPTSFYSSSNFSNIRKKISEKRHVKSVLWLADRKGVFYNVLQEVSIITVGPPCKENGRSTIVRFIEKKFESNFSSSLPSRQGGGPWPIPKSADQLEILVAAEKSPFRVEDYGYDVRVGHLVYNRDKKTRYKDFPENAFSNNVFPIVFPFQIEKGGEFNFDKMRDGKQDRFVKVKDDLKIVVTRQAVVMKRTSPAGQCNLLKCAVVPNYFMEKYGGFVGENHVIIFLRKKKDCSVEPGMLSRILNSNAVNLVYRCFSGTVSVSRYNLINLPLPDPKVVIDCESTRKNIQEAVLTGYGVR